VTAFSFRATATITTSASLSKDAEALFEGIHLAHVDLDTIDDCLLLSSITDDPSDEDTVHVASPELVPVCGRRPALVGWLSPALLGLTPDDSLLDIFDVIGAAVASEDELAACRRAPTPPPKSCGTLTGVLGFNLNFSLDIGDDIIDADFWSL